MTAPTYVDECPGCGQKFIGMTSDEYRRTHALECPLRPLEFSTANDLPRGPRPTIEPDEPRQRGLGYHRSVRWHLDREWFDG